MKMKSLSLLVLPVLHCADSASHAQVRQRDNGLESKITADSSAGEVDRSSIGYSDVNRFYMEDFPIEARNKLQEGVVKTLYLVDKDGKVSECKIEISSGYQILDQVACDTILQRFRFLPALSKGMPTAEWKRQPVRWKLSTPTPSQPSLVNAVTAAISPKQSTSADFAPERGGTQDVQNVCVELGFVRGTSDFSRCALELYQGKQQAEADRVRFNLELRQFEAEQARITAVEQERVRKQRRAKWEALQRFGTGMSQSQSATFAGALADGNAAMLEMPLAHQNSVGLVAPQPVRPRTVTIGTPDGRWVTCTTFSNFVNCN